MGLGHSENPSSQIGNLVIVGVLSQKQGDLYKARHHVRPHVTWSFPDMFYPQTFSGNTVFVNFPSVTFYTLLDT